MRSARGAPAAIFGRRGGARRSSQGFVPGRSGPIMAAMPTGEAELGLERRAVVPQSRRKGPAPRRGCCGALPTSFCRPSASLADARREPRASLRDLLRQDRFHRASALRAARDPASFRDGREAAVGSGHRLAPSLRPRAAAAHYSDAMRELVQSFKYRDRHEGLALFARWLAKAGAELLADADLIVPVPLHTRRLWRRRFEPIRHGALGALPRPRRLLHADAGAATEPAGTATSAAAMSPGLPGR